MNIELFRERLRDVLFEAIDLSMDDHRRDLEKYALEALWEVCPDFDERVLKAAADGEVEFDITGVRNDQLRRVAYAITAIARLDVYELNEDVEKTRCTLCVSGWDD